MSKSSVTPEDIRKMHRMAAKLVLADSVYLPIFERLEEELAKVERIEAARARAHKVSDTKQPTGTVSFNINNSVRVKLTEKGHELLRKDHEAAFAEHSAKHPYRRPEEDAEGYSRWQLWDLMQRFGPHLALGSEVPFDPTIMLEVKAG